jgi:hypothetical protein
MYKSKIKFRLACVGYRGISILAARVSGLAGQEKAQAPTKQAPARIEFQNIVMGELLDENKVHLGFTNFKGSDGSALTVLYDDFPDFADAQDYFDKQILKAAKVIKREKKLDPKGKIIGDRAEILLRVHYGKTIPAILRIDGPRFHEFYSSSRESMLQLEKQYMGRT